MKPERELDCGTLLKMVTHISGYAFVGKTLRYSHRFYNAQADGQPLWVCYEDGTNPRVYHIVPSLWLRPVNTCRCCGQALPEEKNNG